MITDSLPILKKLTAEDILLAALIAPFYSAAINSGITFMLQVEVTDPVFALFRSCLLLLVALITIIAFPVALKRSFVFIAVVGVLLFFLLGVTQLWYPGNLSYLVRQGVIFHTVLSALPCFIFAFSIRDMKKFYKYLDVYAHFIIYICMIMVFLMLAFSLGTDNTYSMSLGYYVVLACIFFLQKFVNDYKRKDLLFFLVGLVTIMLIGSRGPLLCLVVFVGLTILMRVFSGKAMSRQEFKYLLLLLAAIGIFAAILSTDIVVKVSNLLSSANINSRTLNMFLGGRISQDSGRNEIYYFLVDKVKARPFMGYGIGGDRILAGYYAHNIFLALGVFFGVIGALVATIIGSVIIAGSFVLADGNEDSRLLAIFFSVYFTQSLFSADILTNSGFWIIMGLSLNIISSRVRFRIGPKPA